MKNRPIYRSWLYPTLLMLSLPFNAQALDAEDVVRLHASGYNDDQINEVLSATQAEFMLTAREVVYLSQSGISDLVVQNMLVALPLQPVSADATVQAEPVRMLFTEEDLQLLAENRIAEPVIVTFIETRDMAFALDTERLTSLRQSGLGLEALQVLVEKSAAGLPVPLAPPPEQVVAGSGSSAPYFYGNSGNSFTSYAAPSAGSYYGTSYGPYTSSNYGSNYNSYYDPYYGTNFSASYYGSPFLFFQSRTFYPWHGYSGFSPSYVTYYPYGYGSYWSSGYGSHDLFCPRSPHHHGGGRDYHHSNWGGHHGDRDHHEGNHHDDHDGDRDHDDDRDGRGLQAGTNPRNVNSDAPQPGRGIGNNNTGGNPRPVAVTNQPIGVRGIVINRDNRNFGAGTRSSAVTSPGNGARVAHVNTNGIFSGTAAGSTAIAGNSRPNTPGNYSGIFNGTRPAVESGNDSRGGTANFSGIFNGSRPQQPAPKFVPSAPNEGTAGNVAIKPVPVIRQAQIEPAQHGGPAIAAGRQQQTVVAVQPNAIAQKPTPEPESNAREGTRRAKNDAEPAINRSLGRGEKQR